MTQPHQGDVLAELLVIARRAHDFRTALSEIAINHPPDTVAGKLASDVLAKHPAALEAAMKAAEPLAQGDELLDDLIFAARNAEHQVHFGNPTTQRRADDELARLRAAIGSQSIAPDPAEHIAEIVRDTLAKDEERHG